MSIHYYDLFRFFLDDDAESVFARIFQAPFRKDQAEQKGVLPNECDTTCLASVAFKKGAIVQFTCSEDVAGGEVYWHSRYTIAGSKGSIFMNASERYPLQIYRNATGWREPVRISAGGTGDPGNASAENGRLIAEYLSCLEKGESAPTNGADNLKSLAIAEATYLSGNSGLPVRVDDLLSGRQ